MKHDVGRIPTTELLFYKWVNDLTWDTWEVDMESDVYLRAVSLLFPLITGSRKVNVAEMSPKLSANFIQRLKLFFSSRRSERRRNQKSLYLSSGYSYFTNLESMRYFLIYFHVSLFYLFSAHPWQPIKNDFRISEAPVSLWQRRKGIILTAF